VTDDSADPDADRVDGRRRYAKGEKQRALILEKALEVLSESGYRGATIREIAARCEMSHQALRHYFPTKDGLLAEALHLRDDRLRQFFEQPDGLPAEELISFARENLRHSRHVEMYTVAASESAQPGHPSHDYYADYYRGIVSAVTRALSRPEVRSRMPAALDPESVARIVLALQDGLQLQWLYDNSTDTPRLMEQVLALLIGAADTDDSQP
jgi:AcrR family transcriptional regulator